jgi:hypothetical protein
MTNSQAERLEMAGTNEPTITCPNCKTAIDLTVQRMFGLTLVSPRMKATRI